MATRNDLISRAYQRLGVVRVGASVPGHLNAYADDALTDLLLELNEEVSLDFDPTANDIPDERVPTLANLFRYSPALDQFDTRSGPAERELLFLRRKTLFFRTVIGPSDHIEPEPRDF